MWFLYMHSAIFMWNVTILFKTLLYETEIGKGEHEIVPSYNLCGRFRNCIHLRYLIVRMIHISMKHGMLNSGGKKCAVCLLCATKLQN